MRAVPSELTPKRILCLFDYRATTGFATVSQNVVPELKRRFGPALSLDIIPINYFEKGGIQKVDDQERILVPTDEERNADPFCRYPFLRALQHGDYDGYFIIQDAGVLIGMLPNIQEINKQRAKAGLKKLLGLFYFPVDAAPLDHFFNREQDAAVQQFMKEREVSVNPNHRSLGYMDRLVTYTEYGRQEILKKAPWLKDKVHVIPHGVDPTAFFVIPEEERQAFRKEYFGKNADKFLIININRNQFRKDIPTTLLALKEFKTNGRFGSRNRPVFLYLHMHPHDPMGWDLRTVAAQLDLVEGEDYGFPPEEAQHAGSDVATLRNIYNAADVFVTTTTGEGWGLTVVEAMACGCPVVAPNHSSLTEIGFVGKDYRSSHARFFAVQPDRHYCATEDAVLRKGVYPLEVAERVYEVFLSGGTYNRMIFNALDYARLLNWRTIGEAWEEQFRSVFFK